VKKSRLEQITAQTVANLELKLFVTAYICAGERPAMQVTFLGGPADGQSLPVPPEVDTWSIPVPGYRDMPYVRLVWTYNLHPQTGDVMSASFFVPAHLSLGQKNELIRTHLKASGPLPV
jgi:hypothetical protein